MTKKNLRKEIKEEIKFFHGIVLTHEHIDAVLKLIPKSEVENMKIGFDTGERETFVDYLAKYVIGPKAHWPTYSEGNSDQFFKKLKKGLVKKGIKIAYVD